MDERSVSVNGEAITCGQWPLPDPLDGYYHFEVSRGGFSWASRYWF